MATRRNTLGAELLDRPLTARSVIASLLLGRRPPSAPVGLLVRWCSLFGISGTSTRVALSRMVERGELAADHGVYALAGRIRERQAEQDFALAPSLRTWDGAWVLAIVGHAEETRSAADRTALRAALGRARMVPLREGVWTRPDNLPPEAIAGADRTLIASQTMSWSGTPVDESMVASVVEAFGVDAMHPRGRDLLDRLASVTARLPDADVLAEAFVVGAAAAQHLRRDPLLPAELLPADWPGDDLRAAYSSYVGAFGRAVATWSESV